MRALRRHSAPEFLAARARDQHGRRQNGRKCASISQEIEALFTRLCRQLLQLFVLALAFAASEGMRAKLNERVPLARMHTKNVHTRSRTWVVAATTRRPNH